MLTYGPSPFFAGAKLLIICEVGKFLSHFLIIKGQFFYLTAPFVDLSAVFYPKIHLDSGAQASANHSVISSSRYGERALNTIA